MVTLSADFDTRDHLCLDHGVESTLLFILPPGPVQQFRKKYFIFRDGLLLNWTNAKYFHCWPRLCFALSQEGFFFEARDRKV